MKDHYQNSSIAILALLAFALLFASRLAVADETNSVTAGKQPSERSAASEIVSGLLGPIKFVFTSVPYVFKFGSESGKASAMISHNWDMTWGQGSGLYRFSFVVSALLIMGLLGGAGKAASGGKR